MSVLPFTVTNSKLGQTTIYSNTSSAIGHVLIIQYRNKRRRLKNFVLLLSHPVHVSKKIGCWVQSRFREVLDRCLPNKIPMWFNQRPHLKTLVLCHVWQIPDIDRPTFYCIKSFGDFCLSISIKIAVRNVQFFLWSTWTPYIWKQQKRQTCIINWLQGKKLLKRSVNCANSHGRHPMRLKAHWQNGDGYIWCVSYLHAICELLLLSAT